MKDSMNRRTATGRDAAMSHLEIGCQLFHNGIPVQLLYRIDRKGWQETWRVRPLFVQCPDRNEQFHPSDSVSFLHTIRAPRASCAA